jgi:hypothetical protein
LKGEPGEFMPRIPRAPVHFEPPDDDARASWRYEILMQDARHTRRVRASGSRMGGRGRNRAKDMVATAADYSDCDDVQRRF